MTDSLDVVAGQGRRSHLIEAATPSEASSSTKAAIRHAALELFATRGFRATTVVDIADRVGIRAPSLYKHIRSKQELLGEIMVSMMEQLLREQRAAVADRTSPVAERFRRAVEAHVRFHARHRYEAFVGNREIAALDEPRRGQVLSLRDRYEQRLRSLIDEGVKEGSFTVASARLASYAILDMGMGVAVWFRTDGPLSEDQVAFGYGELALRMVGVAPA